MKKIILLSALLTFFALANAQFKQIAEGPVFAEPLEGFAKILQMKNGNTIFFHITTTEGINIRIYNAVHQETKVTRLKLSYNEFKIENIDGIFEIGGNIVLMIGAIDMHSPVLYRVIIDGDTGDLKEQTTVGALNIGNTSLPGLIHNAGFYVRKDPRSDNYAVAIFNRLEPDRNKQIEIKAYGSDNKLLIDAYYNSADEKYQLVTFLDMAVLGAGKVCLAAYGYNPSTGDDNHREFIFAGINKNTTLFNFKKPAFSKNWVIGSAIIRYNPVTKMLVMAGALRHDAIANSNESSTCIIFIDPLEEKFTMVDSVVIPDRINKLNFRGSPQNIFVNDADGSYSVVYEELKGEFSLNSSIPDTESGRIAVVSYDKHGTQTTDYLILKRYLLTSASLDPFYHSLREETVQQLFNDNQYKSFAYLNGKTNNYILIDDNKRNSGQQKNQNTVMMKDVEESDGFYYQLTGTEMIPKREYVFDSPDKDKIHHPAIFTVYDYDPENNLLATLKVDKGRRKKGIKLVWLQP